MQKLGHAERCLYAQSGERVAHVMNIAEAELSSESDAIACVGGFLKICTDLIYIIGRNKLAAEPASRITGGHLLKPRDDLVIFKSFKHFSIHSSLHYTMKHTKSHLYSPVYAILWACDKAFLTGGRQ